MRLLGCLCIVALSSCGGGRSIGCLDNASCGMVNAESGGAPAARDRTAPEPADPAETHPAEFSVSASPQTITLTNISEFSQFGDAMALTAHTLFVGAAPRGSAASAIHFFARVDELWRPTQSFSGSNFDGLGASAAMSGDIAVSGAVHSGTVAVFERASDDTWALAANLTGKPDTFGQSVAVHGSRIAVGSAHNDYCAETNAVSEAGAVFIYERRDAGWYLDGCVSAPTPESLDWFGWEVALWGDTLAIGAPLSDAAARDGGQVHVFDRTSRGWTHVAQLTSPAPDVGDWFGLRIDLRERTLAIGAEYEDSAATGVDGDPASNALENSGATYVFERNPQGLWLQQAYIKASNPGAGDRFGADLALEQSCLVVGAPGEASNATGLDADETDDSAAFSGAAYLFVRDASGVWSQQHYLKSPGGWSESWFAKTVDVDGDTLLVGAPLQDLEAGSNVHLNDAGAIYAFDLGAQSPRQRSSAD